jgi:hypothetical protein
VQAIRKRIEGSLFSLDYGLCCVCKESAALELSVKKNYARGKTGKRTSLFYVVEKLKYTSVLTFMDCC